MRIAVVLLVFVTTSSTFASEFESRYFSSVFAGDLSWVPGENPTTPSGAELKERFDERFLLRVDTAEVAGIDDPLVSAIVRRYQDYWREALLVPAAIDEAEKRLQADVLRLITLGGIATDPDNIDNALTDVLRERGYMHRGGRTRPLLDFMLWRDTRTIEHDVELTDRQQKVVVHFLDDFVIRGWAHFATFEGAGTGGWADRDALYCITAAYDLESEDFTNSYLRHEARHFADYGIYPELEGADLEYRGKLTELAFSSDALRLLKRFQRHGNGASDAPHPLANWHVVNDMAATASASCTDDALKCLESASNENLQMAARRLLAEHSARLDALGAATVTTTLESIAAD